MIGVYCISYREMSELLVIEWDIDVWSSCPGTLRTRARALPHTLIVTLYEPVPEPFPIPL